MSETDMRRALELISVATKLRKQFDEYVLLKRDRNTQGETVQVGDPVRFRDNEYNRINVPIPDTARQYVFRLWRKEVAQRFNAAVRELNQLGAAHQFSLIAFSTATGDPA